MNQDRTVFKSMESQYTEFVKANWNKIAESGVDPEWEVVSLFAEKVMKQIEADEQ